MALFLARGWGYRSGGGDVWRRTGLSPDLAGVDAKGVAGDLDRLGPGLGDGRAQLCRCRAGNAEVGQFPARSEPFIRRHTFSNTKGWQRADSDLRGELHAEQGAHGHRVNTPAVAARRSPQRVAQQQARN